MELIKHTCIKCGAQYEDNDPDDYYCPPCNEERKKIAIEIDKKFVGKPRKPVMSDLQIYDNAKKIRGFVDARVFLP